MKNALADARTALEQGYGVNALEEFTPDEIETIWLPMVQAAIGRQKALYQQGED